MKLAEIKEELLRIAAGAELSNEDMIARDCRKAAEILTPSIEYLEEPASCELCGSTVDVGITNGKLYCRACLEEEYKP